MLKRMIKSGRTGFYFAVTTEGEVGAGDPIELIERADEGLTVADVVSLYTVDAENQELLRRATRSSRLPGRTAGRGRSSALKWPHDMLREWPFQRYHRRVPFG